MNDTTKSEDNPADDGDWLGYGVYADTLWARIERALAKDLIDGELGDDPMVIGIFGEWGAGKSQLLKLIERRAKASLKEQKKKRESDAGFELTVPVWFQPWKYEHEEHLHVPMVIHVLNALKDALKHEATVVETVVNTSVAVVDSGKKAIPVVQKTLEIANSVYPVIQKILKSITVFGCNVDLPDEVGEWLETAADGVRDIDLKNETKVKISTVDAAVKHTTDGSYFYRIHELLGALTRPHSYKHRKDLFKDAKLTLNTRINFVIFIDDLDRCLPEKAVQTLELIKTMFNVESFAFVLALDDEVIERGIGHRYQAYNFAGKKPEMPITGFEYLEKIVHLPFKLPALTKSQAKKFITHVEKKIEPNEPSWFEAREFWSPTGNRQIQMSDDVAMPFEIFDLGELALTAFDAYVPRKLTRLVELWYSTVEIAQKRHEADPQKELIAFKLNAQIDVRIAFAVMLVQLFHPDLYRVFRRHEQTFKTFYDSFVPGGLSESISDIDLWRWAAFSQNAEANKKSLKLDFVPVDTPIKIEEKATDLKSTLQAIAKLDDGYRYSAQQKRLPLVERLIEHRAAQRHVFDALKLFEALKKQMPKLPEGFKIAQYFSLLSEFDEALTIPPAPPVKVDLTKRFTTDANLLYNSVISADEGMQEAIPTLPGFDSGHSVSAEVLESVFSRVSAWLKEAEIDPEDKARREKQLVRGLAYLARFIAPQERGKWWDLVKSESYEKTPDLKLRAQWHDVRDALSQDNRFDAKNLYLPKEKWSRLTDEQEPIPGFIRVIHNTTVFRPSNSNDKNGTPISPYYMARYLTTVNQFAQFVNEGYTNTDNWSENGLAWREREKLSKYPNKWEEQQLFGSRPVRYVSWYEVQAYLTWLNQHPQFNDRLKRANVERYHAQLPTEKQWERAARAVNFTTYDDRVFPWGGDNGKTAHLHANIVGSMIGSPSVVGMFEPNPLGIFDLSGNLWELQNFKFSDKNQTVPLRGGSWNNVPRTASCSYDSAIRHVSSYGEDIGFRLVLSLADSEF